MTVVASTDALDTALRALVARNASVILAAERGARSLGRGIADRALVRTAPVTSEDLAEALQTARREAPTCVVLDGVSSLGGWAALERPEARLARLLDTLEGSGPADVHLFVHDAPLAARLAETPAGADPAVDRLRDRAKLAAPSHTDVRVARRAWRVGTLLVLAIAVLPLVAGVFVGPSSGPTLVLGGLATRVPGALWLDAWIADAIARGDAAALIRTDALWWPFGADLAALFGSAAPAVLAAPFVWAFGYPDFWNVFVASALVANGAAAAALARTAGARRAASLLAGLAFAVAPPLLIAAEEGRQAQLLAFALPLALRSGLRALDGHRRIDAYLTAGWILASTFLWWMYGALALTLLAAACLDRLVRDAPSRRTLLENIRASAHLAAPASLAAIPTLIGFQQGRLSTGDAGSSVLDASEPGATARLAEVAGGSLTLDQLAWGGGPLPAHGVHLGLLGLAAIALVALPRGRRPGWLGVAAVLAVLALGPFVTVATTAYLGPWDLLFRWLPFFSRSGVPTWLLGPAGLFLGVWMALALSDIWPSRSAVARAAAVVLTLGVGVGLPLAAGRLPLARFEFDAPGWWSFLGEEGAVVVLPVAGDDLPLAWQPLHGHPIALGPSPSVALDAKGPVNSALHSAPLLQFLSRPGKPPFTRTDLETAWDQGLRWIVWDQTRLADLLASGVDRGGWNELAERVDRLFGPPRYANANVRVYAVRDAMAALSEVSAAGTPGGQPPAPPP